MSYLALTANLTQPRNICEKKLKDCLYQVGLWTCLLGVVWRVHCYRRTQPTVVPEAHAFGQSIVVVEGWAGECIHLIASGGRSKGHKQEMSETRQRPRILN